MASSSAGSHRRHRLAEDATVGQFIIGGEIGKGSFAQVFIGRHKVSGAAVAVKSVELARLSKKLKENLYGEIKILKTLRHPHIVALHDCVESTTHINLVMEYCELGDLSMFIKKREKLTTNPATHDLARKYPSTPNSGLNEVVTRHFLKQLASALKFLREGNFVHRDVKPQNLLLLPSPNYREAHKSARPILTASNDSLIPVAGLASLPMLKLADFGFARVLPSTTLAETLCGSPLYMAPEILRYEKYDAKADLWSVGTVLYEMVSGRPPFRASNHVELLRKIEAAEDQIKFYRDCVVSADMKALIRALLKRNPVERLSFDNFFKHDVVTGPIPGLVEDDIPRPERPALEPVSERRSSKDLRMPGGSVSGTATANAATPSAGLPRPSSSGSRPTDSGTPPSATPNTIPRRPSTRRYLPHDGMAIAEIGDNERDTAGRVVPASPRDRSGRVDATGHQRLSYSPKQQDLVEGLGIRRGSVQPSSSAPTRPGAYEDRRQHRPSSASLRQQAAGNKVLSEEQERAAQDIAFERDYVLVEKKHVEVNAFADEMAANPRIAAQYQQGGGGTISPSVSPHSAQAMIRRATQQGHPTSATGAVAPTPSRAMQIAQGTSTTRNYHGSDRQGSLSASPKTKSFITKTIYDASFRLLGIKNPTALMGNGASPPQLYSPFPAYPTPNASPALLTDGKHGSADYNNGGANSGVGAASDSDARVAQLIEDYATRSDVVYWFAEVKYKQLVPLAPSAEHDLSGIPIADRLNSTEDDDELTIDAVVVVSEEALVLYIKALSLLAKSMDIASMWWASKMRGEPASPGGSNASQLATVRESPLGQRINAAVQWIRARFNEVLEKAAFSRERLVEAQKRLPEDHPSHPSNHNRDDTVGLTGSPSGSCGTAAGLAAAAGASTDGVFLSPGVSAEKLIYDRAVEMSRTAAIGEISNDDLAGCERSYVTAIRMLEAVLDTDDEPPRRKSSGAKDEKTQLREDEVATGDINSEDQRTVEFMISMIRSRLHTVRRKAQLISSHSRVHHQQSMVRRRSGEVTPRGVSSHAS